MKKRMMKEKRELIPMRVLEESEEVTQEIYLKRAPFHDISKYRAFISSEGTALNPLRDYLLLKFETQDISELLKRQYRNNIGEVLLPSVMMMYMYPDKKEMKKFQKDLKVKFDDVVSDESVRFRVPLKIQKLLRHKAFVQRLRKNKDAMELLHRPVPKK